MQIKISNWKVKLPENTWSWSRSRCHNLLNRSGAGTGASRNSSAPGPCNNVSIFVSNLIFRLLLGLRFYCSFSNESYNGGEAAKTNKELFICEQAFENSTCVNHRSNMCFCPQTREISAPLIPSSSSGVCAISKCKKKILPFKVFFFFFLSFLSIW